MESIKLNLSKESNLSKKENIIRVEYDVDEAVDIYSQKRQLVSDVFDHIGSEYYIEISAILHNKCFRHVDVEEIPSHIMHRALIGTTIEGNIEGGKFLYNEYDKLLEDTLISIIKVNNFDEVIKIINAI